MKNKSKAKVWTIVSVSALCGIAIGLLISGPDSNSPGSEFSDPFSEAAIQGQNFSTPKKNLPASSAEQTGIEPGSADGQLPPQVPQVSETTAATEPVVLWDREKLKPSGDFYLGKVDTHSIETLQVGQSLQLSTPQSAQPVTAKITETRNQLGDNHVFVAGIEGGNDIENVTIVRGKNITYLTVATLEGTYGAEINNSTGEARIWDEAVISSLGEEREDFIVATPEEVEPPPHLH